MSLPPSTVHSNQLTEMSHQRFFQFQAFMILATSYHALLFGVNRASTSRSYVKGSDSRKTVDSQMHTGSINKLTMRGGSVPSCHCSGNGCEQLYFLCGK